MLVSTPHPLLPAQALGTPRILTPVQETGGTLSQAFLKLMMKNPGSWEKYSAPGPSSEGI